MLQVPDGEGELRRTVPVQVPGRSGHEGQEGPHALLVPVQKTAKPYGAQSLQDVRCVDGDV